MQDDLRPRGDGADAPALAPEKYRIKIWFPDQTSQILAASDDLEKIARLWVAWRTPLASHYFDTAERFQWELVDDERRTAFVDADGKIEWSDPDVGPDAFRQKEST